MWSITKAGQQAWENQDTAIPEEHRRLLWRVDIQGDGGALQQLLREYPKHLVAQWLEELNELGLIEARQEKNESDITIPITFEPSALQVAVDVATTLARAGAYIADPSPRVRKAKPPTQATILVVEDDPDQLVLADLRVKTAGYRVRTANSVAELTKQLLLEDMPDLLLLDVLLPDGNGFDLVPKIRRHLSFARMPIVMLTVVKEPEHIAAGLALGVNGYITKPYSRNTLVRVIQHVLGA